MQTKLCRSIEVNDTGRQWATMGALTFTFVSLNTALTEKMPARFDVSQFKNSLKIVEDALGGKLESVHLAIRASSTIDSM